MNFDQLKQFITTDMQMQHIYQPVMLIELLKNGGQASEQHIAHTFLSQDPTQQKNYEDKVRNMVGKVLSKNGITEREKPTHQLLNTNNWQTSRLLNYLHCFTDDLPMKNQNEAMHFGSIVLLTENPFQGQSDTRY